MEKLGFFYNFLSDYHLFIKNPFKFSKNTYKLFVFFYITKKENKIRDLEL